MRKYTHKYTSISGKSVRCYIVKTKHLKWYERLVKNENDFGVVLRFWHLKKIDNKTNI